MQMSESNVRRIVREELIRLMEQEEPKAPSLDDLKFSSEERVAYEQWASAPWSPFLRSSVSLGGLYCRPETTQCT